MKSILCLIFAFSLSISIYFFVFSQKIETGTKPEFYKNFTASEKKLYDVLPEETKQKLIKLYTLTKSNNLNVESSQQKQISTLGITQNQTPQPSIPRANNANLNKTVASPGQQSVPQQNNNPYKGTPYQDYYASGQQQYGGDPNGGNDVNYTPLSAEDMKNLPKLGGTNVDCASNHEVIGNLNGTTNILKMDTNRLCVVFGKKIKVVDGRRPGGCTPGTQHNCGTAIDVDVNNIGDQKMRALLVLAFICSGYNVGSYQRGFPAHFDHEFPTGSNSCGNGSIAWKTWSNNSSQKNGASIPYETYTRDALNIMGMPATSASHFRQLYKCPSKKEMAQKAKAALEKMGIGEGLCRPELKV